MKESMIDKVQFLTKENEEAVISRNFYKQQSERNAQELNEKNKIIVEKLEQLE